MSERPSIDAHYEIIEGRRELRINLWACLWWAIGIAGCTLAAREAGASDDVLAFVVMAGFIEPVRRLYFWVGRALPQKVSDAEADLLREQILATGASRKAASGQAKRLGRPRRPSA